MSLFIISLAINSGFSHKLFKNSEIYFVTSKKYSLGSNINLGVMLLLLSFFSNKSIFI